MSTQQACAGHTRREPGVLESEVLSTLSAAESALTPAQVLDRLGSHLAYTTVMTTLVRLHDKGVITRARAGRAYAYSLVDPCTVTARKMCRELDAAESRERALARFLDELGPADVPVLQRLLETASGD